MSIPALVPRFLGCTSYTRCGSENNSIYRFLRSTRLLLVAHTVWGLGTWNHNWRHPDQTDLPWISIFESRTLGCGQYNRAIWLSATCKSMQGGSSTLKSCHYGSRLFSCYRLNVTKDTPTEILLRSTNHVNALYASRLPFWWTVFLCPFPMAGSGLSFQASSNLSKEELIHDWFPDR